MGDFSNLFTNCILYYPFVNNAKDCIQQLDGTVTSATLTTNRFNQTNSAYNFDGSNDSITNSTGLSLGSGNPVTFSFWMKGTLSDSFKRIFNSESDGSNNGYQLMNGGGSLDDLRFEVRSTSNTTLRDYYIASGFVSDNTLYHVIIVDDGSQTYLYLDGVDKTAGQVGTTGYGGNNNGDLWIGQRGNGNYWTGVMSEFMVWKNRGLSSDECLRLYQIQSKRIIYPNQRWQQ